nr:hypothetical protein [Volvox reticuliferus]
MRKGDRASSKPSSSARAAEVLASKAGAAGLGFGGYAGSALVSPNVVGFGFGAVAAADRFAAPSASAEPSSGADYGGPEAPLMMQVDGELAQCLRHLAKRDPVTKTKALQNLRALIPSRPVVDLRTAMPPWIYMYNRLVLDSSRTVRSEAANTLSCLLTAMGKAAAPHLKALIGPWFLAMYDPYNDAAEASKSAFINAFPAAQRQMDVLLFCRAEIMSYLKDQLAATPQQLGDAKKDTPEELEERHDRVQTACLAALAALLVRMTEPLEDATSTESSAPSAPVAAASSGSRDEVLGAVRAIICRPGFWKATACSKSPVVRRAAYGLARCAAQRASGMLAEGCAAESAVCILGAIGEKEPGNHWAMWEAVLTYGKACPDAWRHVSLRKMLLPRLYSLLRHGCYGSATVSLTALLPLLPLLPPGSLGPDPDVVVSALGAVWSGMQSPAGASRAAKSAGLSAYRECLAWALINSKQLATIHTTHGGGPGSAAAGLSAAASGGTEAGGVGLAQQLATVEGDAGAVPLTCLSDRVALALSSALESRVRAALAAAAGDGGGNAAGEESDLAAACEGAAALLAQLRREAAACSGLVTQLAAAAAQGLMWAGPSGLPPAASLLLATLLREYGSATSMTGSVLAEALAPPPPLLLLQPDRERPEAAAETGAGAIQPVTGASISGGGSFDLHSLVAALKAGPPVGPAAEATADLLVAFCSAHQDNSQVVWEQVVEAVLPRTPLELDVNATTTMDALVEGLQRTALLLQRCAIGGNGALEAGPGTCGGGVSGSGAVGLSSRRRGRPPATAGLDTAQCAAAALWREVRPLAAAAEVLPPARMHQLVRHLSELLAGCARTAVAPPSPPPLSACVLVPPLSPRAWSAHAAQLLGSAPGGAARHPEVLDVLLSACAEWSSWSAPGGGRAAGSAADERQATASAGARSANGGLAGPAGSAGLPAPSLEYLARLVEAAGPEAVLMGSPFQAEEGEGGDGAEEGTRPPPRRGAAGAGPPASGRCWVLLELLCSYHAAMGQSEQSTKYGVGGENQRAAEGGDVEHRSGTPRRRPDIISKAWRRVVGRAADATLRHLVYGAVAEAESGEDADGLSGMYGNSLRNVVDMLAEGCRNRGSDESDAPAAAPAPDRDGWESGEEVSTAQAAFLAALCQVMTCMERASAGRGRGGIEYGSGGVPPPLLSHQQTWCGPAAEDILAASGLPELSCACVRQCLSRPAVLSEPRYSAAEELELVAACFPVPDACGRGGSGRAAAAATVLLVRSAGGGLAVSERPLLKQLVHHQLVRHATLAAAHRRLADSVEAPSPSCRTQADEEPQHGAKAAARTAVMRLSRAAVLYDWRSLGQSEWHALLQIVQEHMSEAVEAVTKCLGRLAAAGRAAADGVLQQPPGTTAAGPMALQLLRRLSHRGTLSRLPQGRQLEEAAEGAMAACTIGPATLAAAQLASLLSDLQDEVGGAAAAAPAPAGEIATNAAAVSSEYGNTMNACCSYAMQLTISLGAVECWGAAMGPGAAAAVAAWLVQHRGFWGPVAQCARRVLEPGREHLGAQAGAAAVAAQATMLAQAGLDAVAALLSVALTPGSHLLQPVAYRLLLSGALLPQMTQAETAAASTTGGGAAGAADVELPQYDGDDVAFLVAGGVRPEMAPWLLPSAAPAAGGSGLGAGACPYLTSWALLLAHTLNLGAGSRGLAVLRQVLREVESLVYGLLDWLVPELGLKEHQPQGERHRPHRHAASRGGGGGGGGASTATMVSADDVERWRLSEALREIGLPSGPHAVRATCRSIYRAALRALPATARGWFGDLRERGLASLVESYTAVVEGPALLAAEIASVQGLKHREAREGRFAVRASAATREVVATMEVEDGAALELLIKLPACMPLRAPEVECRRKVGVNETRLRKWLLSIATFLRHQNSSVADAILLWRRNVDSEFEGVEACLICYSVISSVNGQLPRLVCRTCNVRFHPACLYKWFKSAGKSQCPHCQALW